MKAKNSQIVERDWQFKARRLLTFEDTQSEEEDTFKNQSAASHIHGSHMYENHMQGSQMHGSQVYGPSQTFQKVFNDKFFTTTRFENQYKVHMK